MKRTTISLKSTALPIGSFFTIALLSALLAVSALTSCRKEECANMDPTCQMEVAAYYYLLISARSSSTGSFIAVGEAGLIWKSTDGINKTFGKIESPSLTYPDNYVLNGVAYGNGAYVIAGNNGVLLYSTDGLDWQEVEGGALYDSGVSTDYHFTDVVFYDGKFVAIACEPTSTTACDTAATAYSIARQSSDGIHWSNLYPDLPSGTTYMTLTDIAAGNGLYYAVDGGGNNTDSYGYNGSTWTAQDQGAGAFNDIAFGENTFIAVRGSTAYQVGYTSGAPGTWTVATGPPGLAAINGVTYTGSKFMAVGTADAYSESESGTSWTDYSGTGCSQVQNSIAYGNGRLVSVGAATSTCVNEDGTGSVWADDFFTGGPALNRVVFVNDR